MVVMKKVLILALSIFVLGTVSVRAAGSYEMFYPMVAGKTVADGFVYKLKILKENIRGSLIFGATSKANYKAFLGTKRLLEAEKLLEIGKVALASATLDKSINEFEDAKVADTLDSKDRLENVISLVTDLSKKYSSDPEIKSKLEQVVSKVNVLLGKFSK